MKTTLALLLLCNAAFGRIMEISVSGNLTHGEHTEIFGEAPVPFQFTARYDETALDWLSLAGVGVDNQQLGIYYSDEQPVTFTVGDLTFSTIGSEVRIYSGESGLWGFTFGNRHSYIQHGLTLNEYFGTYGSGIQPFNRAVAPTDELRWLYENFDDPAISISPYSYISGMTADGEAFRFQQTGGLQFDVRPVPEPETWALLLCAIALLSTRATWRHSK